MKLLVLDTETTGFPGKLDKPLEKQPEIFDFSASVLDTDSPNEIIDAVSFKCRPKKLPLPSVIEGKFGSTTEDLVGLPPFGHFYDDLVDLFSNVDGWCAHNLIFDSKMMVIEMLRLNKHKVFPWPKVGICTMKVSKALFPKAHKLVDLHYRLCETNKTQVHTSEEDTDMLVDIVRELLLTGELPLEGNIQIF